MPELPFPPPLPAGPSSPSSEVVSASIGRPHSPPPPTTNGRGRAASRHRKRSGRRGGARLRAAAVLGSSVASTVERGFVCATLDWWPADKCDYGRCPWGGASLLSPELDLGDPLLLAAARRLSPFLLRLGGSLADEVTYEEDDGCVPRAAADGVAGGERCRPSCGGFVRDARLRVGFRGGCLGAARWEELVGFCRRVGCEIVFTVNALRGRERHCGPRVECRNVKPVPPCCTNYTGAWDPSNAAALLRRMASRGQPIAALAYGNELGGHLAIEARLGAAAYAEGLGQLRALVEDAWRGTGRPPPRVIGPNAQLDPGWMGSLLEASPSLGTLSFHLYPLGAGALEVDELLRKIQRPDFLDKLKPLAASARRLADAPASASGGGANASAAAPSTAPSARAPSARALWVTEMGGAYNSGRPGVTDAFASSFWYLDALGVLSLHGTSVVCRQTLLGGSYGLLALGGRPADRPGDSQGPGAKVTPEASGPPVRRVNPDFWAAALWRRLMGRTVLSARVQAAEGSSRHLRAYAACTAAAAGAPAGAVSLLVLNLRPEGANLDLSTLLGRHRREPAGAARGGCGGAALRPASLVKRADDAAGECSARCAAIAACDAFRVSVAGAWPGCPGATCRLCTLHATAAAAKGAAAEGAAAEGAAQAPGGEGDAAAGCFLRGAAPPVRTWLEWRLTSPSLTAAEVLLNGAPLAAELHARGELPETPPRVVTVPPAVGAEPLFAVDPLSANFIVLPEARWDECGGGADDTRTSLASQ